jgi:hypothetical protein
MQIKVVNSNITQSGQPASITITAAAPASNGKGGTLTDARGNSPPSVPISVPHNGSYSFTAASSDGSGGWAKGSLSIQCIYGGSATSPGEPELLTVSYSGEPSAFPSHANNCTGTGSSEVQSSHFTATGSGSQGKGGGCVVTFTVMNGGSSGA